MDNTQATKVNDTTFSIVKPVTTENVSVEYSLDALLQQEVSILKSLNDFTIARNTELEEVRGLISKAHELGIKTNAEAEEDARKKQVEDLESGQ